MFEVNTEDVTVPWGRAPDPLDIQTGRYRMAVFQDVIESLDKKFLYFLYDPTEDEQSGTSGGRKGEPAIVLFDLTKRCFTQEIPLRVQGSLKFLFGLKCPSPSGGTVVIVASQDAQYNNQCTLLLWKLNFNADGTTLSSEPRPLLTNPLPTTNEVILALREDAPELVVMAGPGFNVTRIHCLSDYPVSPIETFSVPGAELGHFYDAFVSRGKIYLTSASPNGHFDNTRVHVLNLEGVRNIATEHCKPDPQRGMPSARRQAALATTSGFLLLAGGEIDYGSSIVRLVDYWILNLETFTWLQIPAQMPIPLIEPRLTVSGTGSVYLWGDFDQPLPGMPAGTHLRILRLSGINTTPPSYEDALKQPKTAPFSSLYPSANPATGSSSYPGGPQTQPPPYGMQPTALPASYPQQGSGQPQPGFQVPSSQNSSYSAPYPTSQQPGYPQQTQPSGYPQPGYFGQGGGFSQQPGYPQQPGQVGYQQPTYPQAPQAPTGQYAHYPPEEKKDCVVQ
uniref:Uncharacterized protein n=1 Tax=Syphacia muris TaxID=451379 RepID=A0A0N5AI34_9BILA